MPSEPTLYDLVLLLSTTGEDAGRTKILADVEAAITTGGGSVERNQEWGRRPTTYQIDHETEAEYHLLQFTGPTRILETLQHSLRIADEVLRFRIIKVVRGTPPAPDAAPPVLVGAAGIDDEGDAQHREITR